MWWFATLALAEPPRVEVRWSRDQARLHVLAPPSSKIADDAPVDLDLSLGVRSWQVQSDGRFLAPGVELGDVRGAHVQGHVDLQVCEDVSGVCRPVSLTLDGTVPDRRKGTVFLQTAEPSAAHDASPFNQDAEGAAETAFAAARIQGGRVLLDFSAVWCPPCNLLSTEVLHAPDADITLAGLHVVVVDVDHPSSWTLKDRYAVGSYPTVVVVEADGTEVDRVVGYPGRDAFLAFVDQARGEPARDWSNLDPSTLEPDDAARGALRLLDGDGVDAAWMKALAASDSVEAHLVRFRVEPKAAEVAWLAEHAPERGLDWLPHAFPWAAEAGRPAVVAALPSLLAAASPTAAADVLWFTADLHEPAEARLFYASAAKVLEAQLTGDLERDRGHIEFLATLLDRAGQATRALGLLDETARALPDDPTFLLAGALHLNEHGEYAGALVRAERALESAWGDNRLRVAAAAAEALVGLDRADDASALAKRVLDEVPAPPEALEVRSHRYRATLRKFLD